MAESPAPPPRPLSPHLQVYKPTLTMTMSIVHRITGIGLYAGMAVLVWWLAAAASGADAFGTINGFFGSWFGLLVLFGFTWALLHHMIGGLKHFIWDTGRGLDPKVADLMARASLILSLGLTVAVWLIAYAMR